MQFARMMPSLGVSSLDLRAALGRPPFLFELWADESCRALLAHHRYPIVPRFLAQFRNRSSVFTPSNSLFAAARWRQSASRPGELSIGGDERPRAEAYAAKTTISGVKRGGGA